MRYSGKWARTKKDGTVVDALFELREERRKLEREADKLRKLEAELDLELRVRLLDAKLTQVRGSAASFTVSTETVAQVDDWSAFFEAVAERGCWDVLQRRVNNSVYRELGTLPGSTPVQVMKTSLRKVSE